MPVDARLSAQLTAWSATPPAPAHRDALLALAGWIRDRPRADLLFVCTHNSRRSHLAQLWAQAAALHAGLAQVQTWSGGTEATALYPRVAATLRAQGFTLEDTGERRSPRNAVYAASFGPGTPTHRVFSKVYGDPPNPQRDFAAIMVCDSADAACPLVAGAALRVSLPFVDPKASDGTDEEAATYAARSMQIGAEMAWMARQV